MKELGIHHFAAKANAPARVRVSYRTSSGSQAQGRETEFKWAITDEQRRLIQWYLEEYLLFPWGEFRSRAQQVESSMERLGAELFDAVFNSREALALYAHVADDLGNTRILIQASDSEGIALPWELLRDRTRGEYGDLANLANAFIRSQPDLILGLPPMHSDGALNILMVICRPGGEEDVPFQSIARPLLDLFRPHRNHIHLKVLRPPTLEQLKCVLTERPNFYHVLHFDGHGAFPQGTGKFYEIMGEAAQGRLLFEREDGMPHEVTGDELGGLLAGKGVPVVLLNACQSGMTRPESLYPSIGNQLLKAGVTGVVAMAYSIYVQTAVRFTARLYEGLLNGEELSRAVALAREQLRANAGRFSPIGEIPLRDWMVPVLFEASSVRFTPQPLRALRAKPNLLQNQQAHAGAEIDCPEPPAFGLVGRDGMMLTLERAFQTDTKTVVLLEGMAGVGKTETAVGFARWRAETGALDGPIFFFCFEHHLPLARVCDRVGQRFNAVIRQQFKADWQLLDAEQRRQVALVILKQEPCLLIWDNFEPVAGFPMGTSSAWTPDEQKELRDFLSTLRGGRTKVLLTSRRDEQWLGNIYERVELGGLKRNEAQELAVKVLKLALTLEEIKKLPPYNKVLDYLHGNPLAIQVILPEFKQTTPDTLLAALQSGDVNLSGDDPTQGRDRSLSTSLNYRLDALDPTLRQRLGILALFQGFVAVPVLETISKQIEGAPELIHGLGRDDWIGMLGTAAEVGLLRRIEEGFYSMHPALPYFFHRLMQETFPDNLARLECSFAVVYGRYGRQLSRDFKTNTAIAVSQLRAEENNLVHALYLAIRHQQWDAAEEILDGLKPLLVTQGRWVEWERLVAVVESKVMDRAGEPMFGREKLWHAVLWHRAKLAEYRREYDKARSIYLRFKDHCELTGDDGTLAPTLHQLGVIAFEQQRLDEAERWYRQSLSVKERLGNEQAQASTLHELGMLAGQRRQFEEAERWYLRSLSIEERIGNEHGQAESFHQLGVTAHERGQLQEAERRHRQSLEINKRIGEEEGQAMALHELGMIAHKQHQLDEAEQWYRQSLAIKERIGYEHGQAITLNEIGTIAEERGHSNEAERWYQQSLVISNRLGSEHLEASTLFNLGRIAQKRGNAADAIRFYEQAEATFERLDDQHSLGVVRRSLQRMRSQQGKRVY